MLRVTGNARVFKPDVKFLKSGKCAVSFQLGTSRKLKDGNFDNSYFSAKAYGAVAEKISEMERQKIEVKGFMAQNKYEGKDGRRRTAEYIVVTEIVGESGAKAEEDDGIPF